RGVRFFELPGFPTERSLRTNREQDPHLGALKRHGTRRRSSAPQHRRSAPPQETVIASCNFATAMAAATDAHSRPPLFLADHTATRARSLGGIGAALHPPGTRGI